MTDFNIISNVKSGDTIEGTSLSPSSVVSNLVRETVISASVSTGGKGDKGDTGDTGEAGPANVLSIGDVTSGEVAEATITGTSPSQVLNLVLPKGADGTNGTDGEDGEGVVAGGTTGQVLAKKSNADYDTEWVDQTGGGGTPGGSDTQLQFNDNGSFAGAQSLTYDKTFGRLSVSSIDNVETEISIGTKEEITDTQDISLFTGNSDNGSSGTLYIGTGSHGGTGSAGKINIYTDNGFGVDLDTNSLTTNRDVSFPDKAGTIAMTSDVVTSHSGLSNLAYADSGHTGFEPSKGSDDNYVTDAEKAGLQNRFNGCVSIPTFTDNNNGTAAVGNAVVNLSSDASGSGIISQYTLTGNTFTFTDGAVGYIVGNYNSGTPVMQLISDVSLINETTIVPIYTVFRNGNFLHTQNWDALGLALANKVHQSIVKTQRYRRESGLSLSESGTRNLNLTSGKIWIGAVPITLDAIASATDNIIFWYHSGGNWTSSSITQYNNTQYDNGTNLASLTANRYAVNWVFRGVESQKHLYVILGTGDYTLSQAQSATVPTLPIAISSHAVLVGKVIVQNGSNTATSIQSAFDVQFSYATSTSHSDLLNLGFSTSGHTGTATSVAGFDGTGAATSYSIDTDLTSVSASDDTVPSAKATKTALDLKANLTGAAFTGDISVGNETTGANSTTTGTLGAEMIPSFNAENWTATNGWAANTTNITRVTNGTAGTITPSGTFNVVVGRTYKIVIVCSAQAVASITYTLGGVTGTAITATTITNYITAVTTNKLIISGAINSTCTITSISVKEQSEVNGIKYQNGNLLLAGEIRNPKSSLGVSIEPDGRLRSRGNFSCGGQVSCTSLAIGGGIATATTIGSTGVNTNSIASLTTSPSDSYVAQCVTAALSGTPVRISPSIVLAGTSWNTTPTAASKVNAMQMYCLPTTGATTTPQLIWANKTVNGSANSNERMRLTSDGSLTVTGASTQVTIIKGLGAIDSYSQLNMQNTSTGTTVSSDVVVTCNDGDETTNFGNFGINGSNYSNAGWTISGARDVYMYASHHALTIGTATAGKDVIFHTGGTLAANIRLRLSDTLNTSLSPIAVDTIQERTSNAGVTIDGVTLKDGDITGTTARLQTKIITATRDASAATGDVSYTGVGFTPTSIKCFMNVDAGPYQSISESDSTKTAAGIYTSASGVQYSSATIATYSNYSAWAQNAVIKSYNADGFTLTWTKVGTPTAGTIKLSFVCKR